MTRTTEHEYHADRPVLHFGSPQGQKYYEPQEEEPAPRPRLVIRATNKGKIRWTRR